MNRTDWQAYLDGSLTPEETRAVHTELAENPASLKEVEGLKSFIGSIRDAAQAEEIPLRRLEALMPKVEPAKQRFSMPRLGWMTAGLAAAAAIGFVLLKPNAPDSTEWMTSDPVAAANWANDRMGFTVPALDLGPQAPLQLVHHGDDHCCFDYSYKGNLYHLNVLAKGTKRFGQGKPVMLQSGIPAQVGRGVTWSQGKWDFYVVGPKSEASLDVANLASKTLG